PRETHAGITSGSGSARSLWYAACCSVAVTASRCRCCPTEPTVVPLTCCLDLCAREPQGLSTVNRGAGRRGEMSGPERGGSDDEAGSTHLHARRRGGRGRDRERRAPAPGRLG